MQALSVINWRLSFFVTRKYQKIQEIDENWWKWLILTEKVFISSEWPRISVFTLDMVKINFRTFLRSVHYTVFYIMLKVFYFVTLFLFSRELFLPRLFTTRYVDIIGKLSTELPTIKKKWYFRKQTFTNFSGNQ